MEKQPVPGWHLETLPLHSLVTINSNNEILLLPDSQSYLQSLMNKAMRLGRAPVGNTAQLLSRGSLGAHYLLYQPLRWLVLSTGSNLMHPFSSFSRRSSCLKRG